LGRKRLRLKKEKRKEKRVDGQGKEKIPISLTEEWGTKGGKKKAI